MGVHRTCGGPDGIDLTPMGTKLNGAGRVPERHDEHARAVRVDALVFLRRLPEIPVPIQVPSR